MSLIGRHGCRRTTAAAIVVPSTMITGRRPTTTIAIREREGIIIYPSTTRSIRSTASATASTSSLVAYPHQQQTRGFASSPPFAANATSLSSSSSIQKSAEKKIIESEASATKVSSLTSTSPWDSDKLLNVQSDELRRSLIPNSSQLPADISGTIPSTNNDGSNAPLQEYVDGSKWDELKKVHLQRHGCVVVWIQHGNMRIKDNYPLALGAQKAQQLSIPLVVVCVVDGRTYAQPSSVAGFFRKSPERATFAIECIHSLRRDLEGKHNTPVLVRTGYPEFIIPDLCTALRARYCFTSTQYAPHENLIENSVRKQLNSKKNEFSICREAMELEEELLRRQAGTPVEDQQPSMTSTAANDGEEEMKTRCVFQPVWDSTMIHYDDLITPAETMKEGIRWYLEELPASTIRPTAPYDCDDGRLEKLSQKVRERVGSEFSYAVGTSTSSKRNMEAAAAAEKEELAKARMVDIYGVEDPNELLSFEAKRGRMHVSKPATVTIPGYHRGGEYEDSLPAPASALPWCILPTAEEKASHNTNGRTFDINTKPTTVNDRASPNPIRGRIPTLDELGYGEWRSDIFRPDNSIPSGSAAFTGGEEHAWNTLKAWTEDYDGLKSFARYEDKITTKVRMTSMYKDHSSSKLSPFIAAGCLSPRSIMHYFRDYLEKNRAQSGMAARWYNEAMVRLGRRDFAHFMGLRYGRSLFFPYGPRPEHTNDIPDWRCDEKVIRRWCAGLTGVPFCDAAMRELTHTGWVAHEGRQALTWLLTRGYGQDWRVAAEWFERCSLDYDPFLTYWWTATSSELIRDDFGEPVFSANYIAHHADQTGLYVKKWFPSMFKIPSAYIHRVHVLTPRMQEMHNLRLGKDYPYPIKLWEGGSTEEHGVLTGTQLKAYFGTEKECSGTGWLEAHRYGTKLVPPEQLPLLSGAGGVGGGGGGAIASSKQGTTSTPAGEESAQLAAHS